MAAVVRPGQRAGSPPAAACAPTALLLTGALALVPLLDFCIRVISLAILSHFYIVKGNRKEAARIAAEFYGVPQGQGIFVHTVLSLLFGDFVVQGYNVDTLTIDQVTPLHEACLGDHVGCARILLEAGANVNATTIDGVTPLFNACSRGSAACAELLLQYGAKAQWESCLPSPTHEAASRGHSECLEVLISWGIDVDQDLPHLGTPLYVACVSQQIHCIRKLLYAGANVQKGKHLQTPLHAAAQHSSTEIVNLLLEFGADINAKNSDFERPVDLAAPSSLVERLLLFHEVQVIDLQEESTTTFLSFDNQG
ncbi:hypothetical protein DUI87_09074 [Hirundo rustica rustica]|uniref:Uncharacterized protein n=1 Tax=Hirundo rustica rustica TaxID=333673 RepID=A0A3M0KTC3_HIRRU|nr:hypothetical protein DUI87_09074 [Hirundo rustica rustica]